MEKKVLTDTVDFPQDLETLYDLEYKKVRVRGSFDYTREVLLGPRSLLQQPGASEMAPNAAKLAARNSLSGYLVITPFKIENTGMTILVNRGWIPSRQKENFKSVPGPVDIIAVVRRNETRPPFMTKNNPVKNHWLYRDVPLMSAYLNTEPIFLDLVSIRGVNLPVNVSMSAPVPAQTRVTLRNEHVSYFFTWFSLSAITAYMWRRIYILKKPLR